MDVIYTLKAREQAVQRARMAAAATPPRRNLLQSLTRLYWVLHRLNEAATV